MQRIVTNFPRESLLTRSNGFRPPCSRMRAGHNLNMSASNGAKISLPLGQVSQYAFADGLSMAVSLSGIVIALRVLRVEEFGLADLLRNLQLLIGGAATLNLFDGAGRFYFETDDRHERQRILGEGLCGTLVM